MVTTKKHKTLAVSYATRYIESIKDTLIDQGFGKSIAEKMSHDEKFIGILHSDPEFVMHHEPEHWAEMLCQKYAIYS